jgi:hypothetical protein
VGIAVLSQRQLNRALLLRQGLLERHPVPVLEMVERLVGLQAQVPNHPYMALWARIAGFDPMELSGLVARREVVRGGLMRATVHLVSARDCLAIEPLTRPVIMKTFGPPFGKGLHGVLIEAVVAAARELLEERPHTRKELSRRLAERFPEAAPASLGYCAASHLPVVQIEPRGEWNRSLQATWALTERHLGRPLEADPSVDVLVLRYLGAFGPATVGDARIWSRLTGLREVFERLRPRLRSFHDERGRELFDVEDGGFADPDTPAPPRLLPQFDNLLLSHEDRARVGIQRIPDLRPRWIGHVLVDGFHAGTWHYEKDVLTLRGVIADTEVEAEAVALLELIAPGAEPRVAFQ